MSVAFFTERGFPRELRNLAAYRHYGGDSVADAFNAVGNIVEKASPWDFLTGIFVGKPEAQAAAQLQETQIQAQAIAQQQAQQQKTLRTVLFIGAGLAGLVVIVAAFKPKPPKPKVAGYRKRRSRR